MPRAAFGAALGLFGAVAAAYASDGALPPLDPERVKAGRIVYQQHCASCHGARAEGAPDWQQPDAQGEMPAPPHNPEGHTWKHSDAMLYRIVMQGWRDPFNKTDRLTMPPGRRVSFHGPGASGIEDRSALRPPNLPRAGLEDENDGLHTVKR